MTELSLRHKKHGFLEVAVLVAVFLLVLVVLLVILVLLILVVLLILLILLILVVLLVLILVVHFSLPNARLPFQNFFMVPFARRQSTEDPVP